CEYGPLLRDYSAVVPRVVVPAQVCPYAKKQCPNQASVHAACLWPYSGRLRMRDWPSIVPGTPEDYFIVVNHFGRFGTAFAETDLDRANYETTVADLISGQHCDPLRVIMFNPETNRS